MPRFSVVLGSDIHEISLYEAEDRNSYIFLPSCAEMEQLTIHLDAWMDISLGGITLYDGFSCGIFSLDTPYQLEINGKFLTTLRFYQSANVPAMYIETASGSMEYIHKDIDYKESATISLYTADGCLDYTTDSSTVKGRGNASWDNPKKPYALTLPPDANLLNMGGSSNWILLANAFDETNLNNKLVFHIANQVFPNWTPDCAYVDLYLNGKYNGLYLLAEKIEIQNNRLAIDADAGDFLCKVDLYTRWNTLRNPFVSASGRTVEITAPRDPSELARLEIETLVNQMEQTLLSGNDLISADNLDLDSWVRRYLIDEISGNIDSDFASSYFYYSNGVFYAGPVWDYDITFGNSNRNQFPKAFIANSLRKTVTMNSPYYHALYQNPSFYNRVCELYRTEFLPILQQLIDGQIEAQAAEIAAATEMNSLRWKTMFQELQVNGNVLPKTAESLLDYISERTRFLNDAWINQIPYSTIQFQIGQTAYYRSISMPTGTLLEIDKIDTVNQVWFHDTTGEPMGFLQLITENAVLTQNPPQNADAENTITTRDLVVAASILMLAGLFIVFLIIKV